MRHTSRRLLALAVSGLTAFTGACASGTSSSPAADRDAEFERNVAGTDAPIGQPTSGSASSVTLPPGPPDTQEPTTTHVPMSVVREVPTVGAAVDVDDAPLPATIIDAYIAGGGDLVEPAGWEGRFGSVGLPRIVGSSARLVEATRRAELVAAGWERTDEASWMMIDGRDRDDLLADVGAAVGAAGRASRTESEDDGAECAVDWYRPDGDGTVWTIQSCRYPRYAGMFAIGVTRTGTFRDGPTVDPTVTVITDMLDGRVGFGEITLGAPRADGSTLHISAQVSFAGPVDIDAATGLLLDGPLAGWQALHGDESVVLSGPTGGTWTITPGVAVFNWAGRW